MVMIYIVVAFPHLRKGLQEGIYHNHNELLVDYSNIYAMGYHIYILVDYWLIIG